MGDSKSEQSVRESKPVAVLISDIHYNIKTLRLADAALRQAVATANKLDVPLIIAGDLHDTKAHMRAECINAMIVTIASAQVPVYVMRGNHDQINEQGEEHALGFLSYIPDVTIVDRPIDVYKVGWLIPYYHDAEELRDYLDEFPDRTRLIMHQGLMGANMGEYFQDKSAIHKDDVHRFRVISGHYHARQDIKIGRPRQGAVGAWSYIGNPYTLGFGEANHPEKGFQILLENGLLEFVPTKLPRHTVVQMDTRDLIIHHNSPTNRDTTLVKVTGPSDSFSRYDKAFFQKALGIDNFRLDFIPNDLEVDHDAITPGVTPDEAFDQVIDASNATPEQKERIKALWKGLK